MNNHDWNQYRQQFPTRYLEEGKFDEKLSTMLEDLYKTHKFKTAVDIGGGTLGTLALKEFSQKHKVLVGLLDPFVSRKPKWMIDKVDWNTTQKFDLIVARGSINYLTVEQLQKTKNMLSKGGVLIANTFLSPPSQEWSEREVANAGGETGVEKSRLVGNVVEHQIIFPNYEVSHNFFYYSLEDYQHVLGSIEVDTYAKNSSLIVLKNQ